MRRLLSRTFPLALVLSLSLDPGLWAAGFGLPAEAAPPLGPFDHQALSTPLVNFVYSAGLQGKVAEGEEVGENVLPEEITLRATKEFVADNRANLQTPAPQPSNGDSNKPSGGEA